MRLKRGRLASMGETSTTREKAQQYFSKRDAYTGKLIKAKCIKERALCDAKEKTTEFEVCPIYRGEGFINYIMSRIFPAMNLMAARCVMVTGY